MICALWICIAGLAIVCGFNFWAIHHISEALYDALRREYGRARKSADEEISEQQRRFAESLSFARMFRERFLRDADEATKH